MGISARFFGGLATRLAINKQALTARAQNISLKDWSEIAKNCFQIVALIVAAVWTYQMFVRKDVPLLQRHATTGGRFQWSSVDSDQCEGSYYVSLKNDGLTDFDVYKVRVRMWEFEIPQRHASSSVQYVDLDRVKRGHPVFERIYGDGAFVRHFPPSHERSERYAWFFKRSPKRNILLMVEFFTTHEVDSDPEWMQYYWWTACDQA
jgi:hypothetical protein